MNAHFHRCSYAMTFAYPVPSGACVLLTHEYADLDESAMQHSDTSLPHDYLHERVQDQIQYLHQSCFQPKRPVHP